MERPGRPALIYARGMALSDKQRMQRRAKIMRRAEKARELDHVDDPDREVDLLSDEPRPAPRRRA